jgi:hypothetical protein
MAIATVTCKTIWKSGDLSEEMGKKQYDMKVADSV